MGCTASSLPPLPKATAKKLRASGRSRRKLQGNQVLRFGEELTHGSSFSSHVSVDHNSSGNFFSGKVGAKSPRRPSRAASRTSRADTSETTDSKPSNLSSTNPLFGSEEKEDRSSQVRGGSTSSAKREKPPLPPRKESKRHSSKHSSKSRRGSESKHKRSDDSSSRRDSESRDKSRHREKDKSNRSDARKDSKGNKRLDTESYYGDDVGEPQFPDSGSKLRKTGPMARSRERVLDYFRRASGSSAGSSAMSLYSGPMDFPTPPPRSQQQACY